MRAIFASEKFTCRLHGCGKPAAGAVKFEGDRTVYYNPMCSLHLDYYRGDEEMITLAEYEVTIVMSA